MQWRTPVRGADEVRDLGLQLWASRVVGPALPATRPARRASRNWRFQFPTDGSETFARRATSATDTSPATIDNTTGPFSSTGNTGALDMAVGLLQQVTTRKRQSCHKA